MTEAQVVRLIHTENSKLPAGETLTFLDDARYTHPFVSVVAFQAGGLEISYRDSHGSGVKAIQVDPTELHHLVSDGHELMGVDSSGDQFAIAFMSYDSIETTLSDYGDDEDQ